MISRPKILAAVAAFLFPASAMAQPIVQSEYRPPETVQRVAIPVNPAEDRLKVLIISGQNSYEHDWTGVNNLLRWQMQDTGRFDVRVTEDFDEGNLAMLQDYDVVLLNYSSRWNYSDPQEHLWSPGAFQALYEYVAQGGGLVAYHSSFTWGRENEEYKRLVGATMQPGVSRRSPPDAFMFELVDREHPITKGLRRFHWTFTEDLYSNMVFSPDADIHVLATAMDNAESYEPERAGPKYPAEAYTPEKLAEMEGMNAAQPQIWVQDYGKGRVFSITLGHGPDTLAYDGLRTLMMRGTEWAATGEVTIPPYDKAAAFPIPGER